MQNNCKLELLEMTKTSALGWLFGQQPYEKIINFTELVTESFELLGG